MTTPPHPRLSVLTRCLLTGVAAIGAPTLVGAASTAPLTNPVALVCIPSTAHEPVENPRRQLGAQPAAHGPTANAPPRVHAQSASHEATSAAPACETHTVDGPTAGSAVSLATRSAVSWPRSRAGPIPEPSSPHAQPAAPRAGPTTPTEPVPHGQFGWPLAPPHPVVRAFEAPESPYGPGHRGVDLAGPTGAPVLSAGAGVVVFAGQLAGRGVVSVDHPNGLRTTYEPIAPTVKAGQHVAAGAVLGHLRPGHPGCPEACLHWGVRRHENEYLDPLSLVAAGRVRLLPWEGGR